LQCNEGFIAPFKSTYAAVVGVSRISHYIVDKDNRSEILIPVTLNLQIVKPDKSKIVFATSNTKYSRFEFSKDEINSGSHASKVTEVIVNNIKSQIDDLLAISKASFNPKATPVKVVGKDAGFIVVDKGFEIGFKDGDEPSAFDNNGKETLFRVISADDGYAVLELIAGDAKIGQEYKFMFATKADDSRKPRVLPITNDDPILGGITDIFTKAIGFKAPFQIAAVDVNFSETMKAITGRSNCLESWGPGAEQVKDTREDTPQYILSIKYAETDLFNQTGKGGVLSKDSFATVVQAKISDLKGTVFGSALGTDKYSLERTAGIGLSLNNAKEISYQNSTKSMVEDLLKKVKFEPKTFKINNVDAKNKILNIDNLNIDEDFEITGQVLRKLSIKVGQKEVYVRLPISTKGNAEKNGKDAKIPFQLTDVGKDYFMPKSGDSLLVYTLPKANAKRVDLCESEYIGKNNTLAVKFATPLVSNVIFNAQNYQVIDMSQNLASSINKLLDAGFFKYRVDSLSANQSCLQPGYLIREESTSCIPDSVCSSTLQSAIIVRLLENSTSKKDFAIKKQTKLQGFEEKSKEAFYSLTAFDEFVSGLTELNKQLDSK
jgi:hypothetical protein